MLLSGAFGALGPPKSVRHQPGSVKLINTPVPSSLVPKSVVNLSRAALLAERLYLFQYFIRMSKVTAVQDQIASLFGHKLCGEITDASARTGDERPFTFH